MANPAISSDGRTITVRVPISIRKRGGRKLVLAPDGSNVTMAPIRRRIDNAMVKAIARAFRWREKLENGTHATSAEIAVAEKIHESYVGRVLRLTLLSPDIVEAILSGRQPMELTLAVLMQQFPVGWRPTRGLQAHRLRSEVQILPPQPNNTVKLRGGVAALAIMFVCCSCIRCSCASVL